MLYLLVEGDEKIIGILYRLAHIAICYLLVQRFYQISKLIEHGGQIGLAQGGDGLLHRILQLRQRTGNSGNYWVAWAPGHGFHRVFLRVDECQVDV